MSPSHRKLVPVLEPQRVSLTPKITFLTSTSCSHTSILSLTKKALAVLSVFGSSERHSGALNRSSFNMAAAFGVIKREVWLNWFCKRPHERLWQNLGVPLPSQSLASCLSHSSCWCASTSWFGIFQSWAPEPLFSSLPLKCMRPATVVESLSCGSCSGGEVSCQRNEGKGMERREGGREGRSQPNR